MTENLIGELRHLTAHGHSEQTLTPRRRRNTLGPSTPRPLDGSP